MDFKAALAGLAIASSLPVSATTLLGPSAYLSAADSPFDAVRFSRFVLQDFDSAGLDTSTVSASAGSRLGSGSLIDSVGGGGSLPGSWYSDGARTLTFDFTAFETLYGALPTHAGIVWTDVGFQDGESGSFSGVGQVFFSGIDGAGNAFGGPGALLGDGLANGGTAEDRFFGAVNAGGIRSITIAMPTSTDWEVDHLQYGRSVIPEPASWALMIAGFGLIGAALRRRPPEGAAPGRRRAPAA
jgi:hypothetical protein